MLHLKLFVALVLCMRLASAQTPNNVNCPPRCVCTQTSVDCANRHYDVIPFIHPSFHKLNLRLNNIQEVIENAFSKHAHLQIIYLNKNRLYKIHENAFDGLLRLRELHLDNNQLTRLAANTFSSLLHLQRLFLQSNALNHLETGLFSELKKLQHVNLDNNRLTTIDARTFESQQLSRLQVYLRGNPISCDCNLKGFLEFLEEGRRSIDVIANCESPEILRGKDIKTVKTNDIQCVSNFLDFKIKPSDVSVNEHDTASFHCIAEGFPETTIQWEFDGESIKSSTNKWILLENGTLIIREVTRQDIGEYTCKITNGYNILSASSQMDVHSLISVKPERVTAKSGSNVLLECSVAMETAANISWKRNGVIVSVGDKYDLGNDNMELTIHNISKYDSGAYLCSIVHDSITNEASAIVEVISSRGPPSLTFEPYDLDALPGTTIELPCRGEGDPIPKIKWRKDGRTILSADRYDIGSSGSLFVKNVTTSDAGRYECSVVNDYGRATASGLVVIKNNEVLQPGEKIVRIAFSEASREIDRAINDTIDALFSPDRKSERHHGELFKQFRYPQGQNRELARTAEIYERTLYNIRKQIDQGKELSENAADFNYTDVLSTEHLQLIAQLSGCQAHRITPNCTDMCFHAKYRTIDGTCNNLQHPTWASSLTGFYRLLSPTYENGINTPIGWDKSKLYFGFPKPSGRMVSSKIIRTDNISSDEEITHMTMQWGQFLDHDLDHAIPSVSSESWDGVDCKKTCDFAAPCFPIEVPENDNRINNRRCIDFVRSSAICGSGMTSIFSDQIQAREQINQPSSFIDGSQLYGFTEEFADELRNLTSDDGLMRTGVNFPGQKSMLPFAAPQDGIDCRRDQDESKVNCFTAGDIRVNEQIGLTAMHIVWLRQHNYIAQKLRVFNPHWDGDRVFEETRKIVGAQMQHITYKHWLPLILGTEGMRMLGKYEGYDATIDATISNEFATAALRFGHSLINPVLHRLNESFQPIPQGHLPLHKAFFAPWRIVYEGGIDPLMRGLYSTPAKLKKPNENLNNELTEKLFLVAHAVALDLAAINIQRSRDHGIPGYNDYRGYCNMKVAESFDDLAAEISSKEIRDKLEELYGHPSNIDIWVGGILEDQVDNGRVGPLFRCILIDQFKRLRDGDRFWYENPSSFTPDQLSQIKVSTLGRVLCNTGDNITQVTNNIFLLPSLQGGYKSCGLVDDIDYNVWTDCKRCSAHKNYSLRHNSRSAPPGSARVRRDVEFIEEPELNDKISSLLEMIDELRKNIDEMKNKMNKLGVE